MKKNQIAKIWPDFASAPQRAMQMAALLDRAPLPLDLVADTDRDLGSRHGERTRVAQVVPGGLDPAVGALDVRDAELVDIAMEGVGRFRGRRKQGSAAI